MLFAHTGDQEDAGAENDNRKKIEETHQTVL